MTSHSKVIAPSPKYFNSISSSLNSRFGNYPQSTSPNNLFPNASSAATTASLTSQPAPPSTPPPLDELLNDCFLFSIDELRDPYRVCHVKKFIEFTTKHHCEENLKFLVEIYKYEFNYDRIFPISSKIHRLNNTPSPSLTSFLNSPSIDSCIGKSSTSASRKKNYAKSILSTTTSLKSEDLDPNAMFVSTIDDLEPQNLSTINSNIWEGLKEKTLQPLSDSDDDDGEDDALDDEIEEDDISDSDREALASQWDNIIVNYIQNDAPDQINLSQKLCDQIHQETAIERTHKPWILLTAKNEVFQIIKENAYMDYSSRERANCSKCSDNISSNDSSNGSNNVLPSCRELSSPKSTSLASSKVCSNASSTMSPGSPATVSRSIEIKGSNSGSISPMGYLNKQSYKHVKNKLLSISTSVSSLNNNSQHTSPMNPTPASLSVSPNHSSSSSITNLFGHLKLYNNSNSSPNSTSINNGNAHHANSSHQHNNIHHFGNVSHGNTSTVNSGTSTPVGSTLHSLTNSPEGLTPTSSTVSSLKFWNKKKTNHS
ncbi:hypothetical protein G9P44_000716 [Scheffersomyces stipitis]|nr:hypothetical protein G9P44_000716 [Scheffersomyces stipitis]